MRPRKQDAAFQGSDDQGGHRLWIDVTTDAAACQAILRFWILVLAAYVFLEEERAQLAATTEQHLTIGDAQRALQRAHSVHLLNWLRQQVQHQETFATIVRQLAA